MLLAPGTVIDRYTVESALGRGGMAEVYAVRHRQLGSIHALKILTAPSSDVRARLLQEGRVQAQLRHRNIVAVTDVIDVTGSPGLVMEYIAGPTLSALMGAVETSFAQVDRLARGIISGVAAAHEHGLVHRDLKPANILLDIADGDLIPKVADFGLVKIVTGDQGTDHEMTRSGVAMGTPAFMAPEQIRDTKTVDHRADLFSLGAILYELACGQRAFPGEDMLDIFTAIVAGDFVPPEKIRPDLPQRMVDAITWALQVDLEERVPHCKELLDTWCEGNPHTYPWEPGELRWSDASIELARSHGHDSLPSGVSHQERSSPTMTWPDDLAIVSPDDTGPPAAVGPDGVAVAPSPSQRPFAPPPTPAPAQATLMASAAADGTLSPDNAAPDLNRTPRKSPRVSGAVLGLAGLALLAAGGWWWSTQNTPAPTPQGGVRFPATAPTVPAPLEATPTAVVTPAPEEAAPEEAAPEEAAPEEAAPEPPALPPEVAAPEPTEPPPVETPPPEAPAPRTTASFSWSGSVNTVRLRDAAGSLFGPGEVLPGTYSIYIRVEGSLRRVGSATLAAGQHRNFECSPLGCQ